MKFKNIFLGFCFIAALVSCGKSGENAKTASEKPINPTPLGLEIHYANINGVKEKYANVHFDKSSEIDQYTGGIVLTAEGAGFNIDGLKITNFTFSKEGVLEHVGLLLNKNVVAMDQNLSSKYEVTSKKINTFMGFGNAEYVHGDTIIKLLSEHLSSDMYVKYTYKPLNDQIMKDIEEKKNRAVTEQKSKF